MFIIPGTIHPVLPTADFHIHRKSAPGGEPSRLPPQQRCPLLSAGAFILDGQIFVLLLHLADPGH